MWFYLDIWAKGTGDISQGASHYPHCFPVACSTVGRVAWLVVWTLAGAAKIESTATSGTCSISSNIASRSVRVLRRPRAMSTCFLRSEACARARDVYPPLAKSLLDAAFNPCWTELSKRNRVCPPSFGRVSYVFTYDGRRALSLPSPWPLYKAKIKTQR